MMEAAVYACLAAPWAAVLFIVAADEVDFRRRPRGM